MSWNRDHVDLCLIHVIDLTLHDNITDLKAEKLKLTDGLAVNTVAYLDPRTDRSE